MMNITDLIEVILPLSSAIISVIMSIFSLIESNKRMKNNAMNKKLDQDLEKTKKLITLISEMEIDEERKKEIVKSLLKLHSQSSLNNIPEAMVIPHSKETKDNDILEHNKMKL